ncbi:hypothetical protein BKA67DRAFT_580337, partial [Truncatella angustata]
MDIIATAQVSSPYESSGSVPLETAGTTNNIVQPNSSASPGATGAFLVTPSQIAAIVIGTIVGTAILTLLVVYSIVLCREKRRRKYEKYKQGPEDNYESAPNVADHDDQTGRAEGRSTRDEKRAKWSIAPRPAVAVKPIVSPKHPAMPTRPQQAQLISHRSKLSLPALPEESPRVSDQFDLHPPEAESSNSALAFHALSYTPEQPAGWRIPEPDTVKLTLTKRQSRGGRQRLAVTRVGGASQQASNNTKDMKRAFGFANPYAAGPSSWEGEPPFRGPPPVRTPSSETLPYPSNAMPSPLALNPPAGISTTSQYPSSTWGPWCPEPLRTASGPRQYENLNAQVHSG